MHKKFNPSPASSEAKLPTINLPENVQWNAESAYYKALARNFTPNHDEEDWLEAINDYQEMLSNKQRCGLIWLVCDKIVITSCSDKPDYEL